MKTREKRRRTRKQSAHWMGEMQREYEVVQDGQVVASVSGPFPDSLKEAMHYAQVYSADGPTELRERNE